MTEPKHQPTTQLETDLAIIAAGGETGWFDNRGNPAPWPDDFFDPDNDWRCTTTTPLNLAPGEQPF